MNPSPMKGTYFTKKKKTCFILKSVAFKSTKMLYSISINFPINKLQKMILMSVCPLTQENLLFDWLDWPILILPLWKAAYMNVNKKKKAKTWTSSQVAYKEDHDNMQLEETDVNSVSKLTFSLLTSSTMKSTLPPLETELSHSLLTAQ